MLTTQFVLISLAVLALVFALGGLFVCWRVARRSGEPTMQVVRETLTIQGGGGQSEE